MSEQSANAVMAKPQRYGGVTKSKMNKNSVKIAKEKNTRSLNSFIAFRGFYSVLFHEFQQKVISTYIVFLWEQDPFKAKWTLVAKAYSMIRDQVGKEHAPLDTFLTLVMEFVGIIEPQEYLGLMGWEISVDDCGVVSLMKREGIAFDHGMLSTNVSVEDIISYACQHGFITANDSINVAPDHQPLMTMAATAQTPCVEEYSKITSEPSSASNGTAQASAHTRAGSLPMTMEVNMLSESNGEQASNALDANDNQNLTASAPDYGSLNIAAVQSLQNLATVNTSFVSAARTLPSTLMAGMGPVDNPFSFDNILDWNPESELPFFNPNHGDKFDAFDISAWIHDDSFLI
ncbi:MAG: hypothetical protein Q9220_006842 [cf. Caloplaca sp. 1 TL-2023]